MAQRNATLWYLKQGKIELSRMDRYQWLSIILVFGVRAARTARSGCHFEHEDVRSFVALRDEAQLEWSVQFGGVVAIKRLLQVSILNRHATFNAETVCLATGLNLEVKRFLSFG